MDNGKSLTDSLGDLGREITELTNSKQALKKIVDNCMRPKNNIPVVLRLLTHVGFLKEKAPTQNALKEKSPPKNFLKGC